MNPKINTGICKIAKQASGMVKNGKCQSLQRCVFSACSGSVFYNQKRVKYVLATLDIAPFLGHNKTDEGDNRLERFAASNIF